MMFEFEFGKVTYAPGAKNAPRWIWRCKCGCSTINGPFRTLRAAEADAEATALRGVELAGSEAKAHHSVHHH